ncbi:MAG TPA: hypothetical protein IAA62_00575 [Candidatus Caccopulliclostridium gallistercoris]|uniref:Uncharacterized protein n=1 Tax=Candidatus Caccopulliclostridium gallistercoris TaxID=2840719 RepID=A0A9D1NE65_9FIRM|nr:hypothetical protein [Candidatus Caccopulliclostridium gallistercoris]
MKAVKIIGGIVCCLALAVLIWGMLYFSVDPIKEWTDQNIFQIEQTIEDEETENSEDDSSEISGPGEAVVDEIIPNPDAEV